MFVRVKSIALAVCGLATLFSSVAASGIPGNETLTNRHRVVVVSDIANEPDDAMSLVRFLLYSHQFDVQGIVASTSTWLRNATYPDQMVAIVEAYRTVLPNLKKHETGWPDPDFLINHVMSGLPVYGLQGVGPGKDTNGSELIIKSVDHEDPAGRPVWVTLWGGAAVLAQALWKVQHTRSPQQLDAFVKKIRVYAISDQDDAGPWIREQFPTLFYISSAHTFNVYNLAAWRGISGINQYYAKGSNTTTVTHEWIKANIQLGPLGAKYPDFEFIMEGDTPSFLYLIDNGLGSSENPSYGSWGGRYGTITTKQGHFVDTLDQVNSTVDGQMWETNQATIWRWREAYQNDFASRIQWSLTPNYTAANHPPVVIVNGHTGTSPIKITAKGGSQVTLNASASYDPDGHALSYRWWHYREPSLVQENAGYPLPDLGNTSVLHWNASLPDAAREASHDVHIILEASDSGSPPLVRYRRIIVNVTGIQTANPIPSG